MIYKLASCEACSVSVSGKRPNATDHSGSVSCRQAGIRRRVLVTPLSVASNHTPLYLLNLIPTHPTQTFQSHQERSVVSKVLLKAVSENEKDHGKYFVSTILILKPCADLNSIIRRMR